MQVSLTVVLGGWNARRRVHLIHLCVGKKVAHCCINVLEKKVAHCCIPFKGFKQKNNQRLIYLKVKNYIKPRNKVLRG